MISAHHPPKKPLGEIAASDKDADVLAASQHAEEDALSRLAECERRLKQATDYCSLLKARAEDPAQAQYSLLEHDRLATDMANGLNVKASGGK